MVSSYRTRRQCLSFCGRGAPSQGQRSTSDVESPDGGNMVSHWGHNYIFDASRS